MTTTAKLSALTRLNPAFIVSACCVLGLLYFGREILEPLAFAAILSLVVMPLARWVAKLGLSHAAASLVSVLLLAGVGVLLAVVLAFQLVNVTSELPRYREAIQLKVDTLREVSERPFARIEAELGAFLPQAPAAKPSSAQKRAAAAAPATDTAAATSQMSVRSALGRLFWVAWGPIGKAGITLVLLIFILLEQEAIRDRLFQLAGQAEISRTVKALADAADGISRFFFSQFIVNAIFGLTVGLALWAAGVPHAALWATLSGVLRFVPYLGALASAAIIGVFAAAVDTGWWLAIWLLSFFLVVEVLVANFIEPRVYGHSSGLSPLAIIISALFWGSLWGPGGLLLSTPLTLCLVVAGRHVLALEPLSILLGEAPNVSQAQRFYQRILAGENEAIIRDARLQLQKSSFAKYCDQVLLPALAWTAEDFRRGQIGPQQQQHIREAMSQLALTFVGTGSAKGRFSRRRGVSLLNSGVGAHLRKLREERLGRWQGSLDVPAHSIVLCAGLAHEFDELMSELLGHALRTTGIDARSVAIGSTEPEAPGRAELVATVLLTYPRADVMDEWKAAVQRIRSNLPETVLATVRPPFEVQGVESAVVREQVDVVLRSFEEAVALVASSQATA